MAWTPCLVCRYTSRAQVTYWPRNSASASSPMRMSWTRSAWGSSRPAPRPSTMICASVAVVRSSPVLASTTRTSLPWRTLSASSSSVMYRLWSVSYSRRFPYFLTSTPTSVAAVAKRKTLRCAAHRLDSAWRTLQHCPGRVNAGDPDVPSRRTAALLRPLARLARWSRKWRAGDLRPRTVGERAQLPRDRGGARSRRPPGPRPRSPRPRPDSRHRPGYARLAPPRRGRAGSGQQAWLPFLRSRRPFHGRVRLDAGRGARRETDPAPGPDRCGRRSRAGRAPAHRCCSAATGRGLPDRGELPGAHPAPGRGAALGGPLGGALSFGSGTRGLRGAAPDVQGRGGRGPRLRFAAGREELLAVPDDAHATGPRGAPAPARHGVRGGRQVARRLPRGRILRRGRGHRRQPLRRDGAPRLAARHRRLPHLLTSCLGTRNTSRLASVMDAAITSSAGLALP